MSKGIKFFKDYDIIPKRAFNYFHCEIPVILPIVEEEENILNKPLNFESGTNKYIPIKIACTSMSDSNIFDSNNLSKRE